MAAPRDVLFLGGGGTTTLTPGTTVISGGTDTRVLFNDGGTVGEDAGFVYNKTTDIATLAGGILVGAGTKTAPSISFSGNTGVGLYSRFAGGFTIAAGGIELATIYSAGSSFIGPIGWGRAGATDFSLASAEAFIYSEAANTLAQRNGTAAQIANLYDTWASTTDYHRLAMKTARATLSGVSGASVTATAIIPDGAVVLGVTTKVTTGLGITGGTTGYQVGDGSDADRWGAIVGTAAGTSSDNTNWTATTIQAFTAASDIVITAVGGNFDATGVIYVSVQYLIGQCD